MKLLLLLLLLVPFLFGTVRGEIVTKTVEYNEGNTVLEGFYLSRSVQFLKAI